MLKKTIETMELEELGFRGTITKTTEGRATTIKVALRTVSKDDDDRGSRDLGFTFHFEGSPQKIEGCIVFMKGVLEQIARSEGKTGSNAPVSAL